MHTVSLKIETLRRFIALERRWANRARCRFGGFTSVPFDFLYGRCDGCESVLRSIEKQIQRANSHKEKKQKQKSQVEAEVNMWYNFDKNVGFMASVCLFETVDGVAIGFFFFIHCSPPPPPPPTSPHTIHLHLEQPSKYIALCTKTLVISVKSEICLTTPVLFQF